MYECDSIAEFAQALSGAFYRGLIAVNSDEPPGSETLCDLIRVPAETKRSIDIYAIRLDGEVFNTFIQQN